MTDPYAPLDPARVERILAPFDGAGDRLAVAVLDPAGVQIAASSSGPDLSTPQAVSLVRDIHCGSELIGQLVATGPAAADPPMVAALDALATGLGQLAEADARELAAELEQGRVQQRSFVSLNAPDVPGYDLASHYEAAREIGGDFFELVRQVRVRQPIGVVIADVTGKGIGAGMLMAFARPVIHAALEASPDPADALERTNRILVEEIHSALFITAIAGTLDVGTGHLRLANAGHEPPLLVPAGGGPIAPIEGAGVLMGAFRSLGVTELDVTLRPGDVLLLYTDGVTDAMAPTGERFGEPRLLATIEAARHGSAHTLVAAIRDAIAAFRGTEPPADDVTIVAIGRHAR